MRAPSFWGDAYDIHGRLVMSVTDVKGLDYGQSKTP